MKRIFLVGYMGAGKTTVGKALARHAGLTFIDLDYYIEGRFHKSVSQIFAEKGEDGFRDMEHRMLHEVADFEDVLISTGGGTPCFFDNMEFMSAHGTTIYLEASVDELVRRLDVGRQTRPVLKGRSGEELRAFIADSLVSRLPFYEKAAMTIDAEKMRTESEVQDLVEALMKML